MKKLVAIIILIILFLGINGAILFFATRVPKINIEHNEGENYKNTQVTFTVDCQIPLKYIKTTLDGEEVQYTENDGKYYVDSKLNGTLKISAMAMNGIESVFNYSISQIDDSLPVIDPSSVSITAGILTLTVSDTQSGINYDSIYAVDALNKKITPSYVNKELGVVQFKMDTDSLVVHIEDTNGNAIEATYKAK